MRIGWLVHGGGAIGGGTCSGFVAGMRGEKDVSGEEIKRKGVLAWPFSWPKVVQWGVA